MKILKRISIGIIILIVIAITLVYVYKDTLIKRVVENYNKNYNITIDYEDTDLSLFKKFPNANLAINNLSIVNDDMKDTLFVAKKVYLAMNLEDLFKNSDEKIIIKDLLIEDSELNLLVNKDGLSIYDVKKISETSNITNSNNIEKEKSNNKFTIDIKKYELVNSNIIYKNAQSDILLELNGIDHTGNGDFSASNLDLVTLTKINELTVASGKIKYFNKAKIELDAILGIDLENLKFTFKENKVKINDLALVFNGFLGINENSQNYNIDFNAPNANFKNILSLIPSAYSSNFSGVSATGIANVNGFFKGELSQSSFPKYKIHINTKKASFKYPDLPKSVTDINFNGFIASNTSKNNLFLDVQDLKFTIDKDTFETNGKITNLTINPTVDANFKGTLNLESLTKAYPIKMDKDLKGLLKANFSTQADKNSVTNNQFDKIKTNGTASLSNFSYSGKDIANPIHIKNAAIKFKTNNIQLTNFDAKTGKSDIKAKGNLDNLFAFIFDEKDLKGNFNVTANNFVISDFLTEDSNATNDSNTKNKLNNSNATESLKIPDFLDITTQFTAKRVVYDNLELKNVSGLMTLKNQKATLKNTKAKMLDGQVVFNGDVNTKPTPAVFDMDMNIDKFDIGNSFKTLETFKSIVPIAKALQGKYNTTFKLKGKLDDKFSPDLKTLSGNAFAQLFVNNVDKNSLPLISELNSNLNFIDFSKLDLSKLKTHLSFNDGKVSVKPFAIKYQGMTMHISGSHGFDKTLQYNLKMDVPAKHLGTEAVNLLSKLTNISKDTIKIPLSTIINGTMLKPTVKVNFKQAISQLAIKVIEYQKQELTNQVTDKVNDVISDILTNNGLGGNADPKDNSTKDSTNQNPKDILNNGVKDGVKDILGGLFGGKKKNKK